MHCTNPTCHRLLEAAMALLEARTNQMVTAVEWDALRNGVTACGGVASTAEEQQD